MRYLVASFAFLLLTGGIFFRDYIATGVGIVFLFGLAVYYLGRDIKKNP